MESERHAALLGARKQRLDTLRQAPFAPLNVIDEREGEHSQANLQVTDLENGEEDNLLSPEGKSNSPVPTTGSQDEDQSNYIAICGGGTSNSKALSKALSRETGV